MNEYSTLERLIHRLAFSSSKVQIVAAEIEDMLTSAEYEQIPLDRPIFITSLPRAGTTVLLTALHSDPTLATHSYRDMPFVMAPLLWSRISGAFQRKGKERERAHKDGMLVGFDSPEAFEEVFWRIFWPEKYSRAKAILLWEEKDVVPEASLFLHNHMRKIIALRCGTDAPNGRYISKNNTNIARLDLIHQMFPDAKVVVPVRKPLAQANSLLRQHLNFLGIHDNDSFARQYMKDIGHLEFGALHRPIGFSGFKAPEEGLQPTDINYWVAYWIAAYEHVQAHRQKVIVVSYDQLCTDQPGAMTRLCEKIGLNVGRSQVESIAAHFSQTTGPECTQQVSSSLLARASGLYEALV